MAADSIAGYIQGLLDGIAFSHTMPSIGIPGNRRSRISWDSRTHQSMN